MIIAHWKLVFSSGEILKSHRIYASKGRACRYLQSYLIRHHIAPRWENGVELVEYHVSLRDDFTSPRSGWFSMTDLPTASTYFIRSRRPSIICSSTIIVLIHPHWRCTNE